MKNHTPHNPDELRRQSEERLSERQRGRKSEVEGRRSSEEILRLVHELRVHQIQLEMQNEELRRAQVEIEAARDRYSDLYHLAPVGYCTLSEQGLILKVNLTGALLLGVERTRLDNRRFGQFVAGSDRRAFNDFLAKVFASEAKTSCEVILPKEGSQPLVVRIEGRRSEDGQECHAAVLDITERKQVAEALRKSEEKFRLIVDNSSDLIWILKPDGVFSYVSPSWELVLGYEPSFMEGKAFQTFVHPEDVQACEDYLRDVIDVRTSLPGIQYRAKHADGSWRWHEGTISPVYADDGSLMHVVGVSRDITVQKQAEEALLASEVKFRSIFASMTEMVMLHELVCDKDGRPVNYRILDCNPAFTQITGIRRDDAVGRLATDVYGSDTAPYLDEYARVAMTGEPCTFIAAYTLMDKHFDVHAASSGKNMFITVTTDITVRKQSETYREMEREILEILNEPGDLQESIQRVLAALKTRTGVDAVGLRLQEGEDFPYFAADGFPADFLQTENTLVERGKGGGVCRDKEGNVSLECSCGLVISGKTDPSNPLFTQGGSCWTNDSFPLLDLPSDQDLRLHPRNNCIHQGYASVALIPVRNQERIVGLIQLNARRKGCFTLQSIQILESIAAHIGSALMRKQAGDTLQKSNEGLQQALQALQKAQKQIIRQERLSALGQMASGIAHDFNNTLMPIIGFSDMLLSDPSALDDREEVRHMLEKIHAAGTDARYIVQRLRQIYKEEAPHYDAIDLAKVLESSVALTQPKWKEEMSAKGVTLHIATEFADVPLIKGDIRELREAFINLIFNAVDAMPQGGIITFGVHSQDNTSVVLEMTDTGHGMDEMTLQRCMEPFFTTKGTQGSGLGLAMVQGIVERHGGTIHIESKPGTGTTTRMRFPVPVAPDAAARTPKTAPESLPPLRVLVIDDEARSRNVIQRILQADGHAVKIAEDGQKGVEMALRETFDLVVADCAMPLMSGDQVAREIGRAKPETRIIMLTGFGDIMKDQDGCPEGVSRVLAKPVTGNELRHVMRDVMTRGMNEEERT